MKPKKKNRLTDAGVGSRAGSSLPTPHSSTPHSCQHTGSGNSPNPLPRKEAANALTQRSRSPFLKNGELRIVNAECNSQFSILNSQFSAWELAAARQVLSAIKGWSMLARRGADDARILFHIAAGAPTSGRRRGREVRGRWTQWGIIYGGDDCRLLLDIPASRRGGGQGDQQEYDGARLAALARAAFQVKSGASRSGESGVGTANFAPRAVEPEPGMPPEPFSSREAEELRREVARLRELQHRAAMGGPAYRAAMDEQFPAGHFLRKGHYRPASLDDASRAAKKEGQP